MEFLIFIYNQVKELGLVTSQCEFSIMCGRTPTWFSTIKSRKLLMTTDALLTLNFNVKAKIHLESDAVKKSRAYEICAILIEQAHKQVGKKMYFLSDYPVQSNAKEGIGRADC